MADEEEWLGQSRREQPKKRKRIEETPTEPSKIAKLREAIGLGDLNVFAKTFETIFLDLYKSIVDIISNFPQVETPASASSLIDIQKETQTQESAFYRNVLTSLEDIAKTLTTENSIKFWETALEVFLQPLITNDTIFTKMEQAHYKTFLLELRRTVKMALDSQRQDRPEQLQVLYPPFIKKNKK